MSWFHYTKQERFRSEIAARRESAEVVRKSIRRKDFYALNPRVLDDALHDATETPYTFEEYFQEAAPQQIRKAAELEVQLWTKLRDAHNAKQFGDKEYELLLTRTGLIVTALIDLLHAEEEMTSSPLVAHFLQIIDGVRKYASRGDA